MCRAQHFTCIISLNPHGGPKGESQLLSSFAYKEPEKQRATHRACTGAHSEDKVKSGFESKHSDSQAHMNHYSKFIFSKHRIPRQPLSPYQALPYLIGSEQIKRTSEHRQNSSLFLTHNSASCPLQTRVYNCKDQLSFFSAPFISSRAELPYLSLLKKEQNLQYIFGSYQQRSDIEQMWLPKRRGRKSTPWGANLVKRNKIGTIQKRLESSNSRGKK